MIGGDDFKNKGFNGMRLYNQRSLFLRIKGGGRGATPKTTIQSLLKPQNQKNGGINN